MFNEYLRSLFYFNAKYDYLAGYLTTWARILIEEKSNYFQNVQNCFSPTQKPQKLKICLVILFLLFKASAALFSHFVKQQNNNNNNCTTTVRHDFHSELLAKTNAHLVHTAFCTLAAYHYWSFYLQGEPFTNGVFFSAILQRRRSILASSGGSVQSLHRLNQRLCSCLQKIGVFISKFGAF